MSSQDDGRSTDGRPAGPADATPGTEGTSKQSEERTGGPHSSAQESGADAATGTRPGERSDRSDHDASAPHSVRGDRPASDQVEQSADPLGSETSPEGGTRLAP